MAGLTEWYSRIGKGKVTKITTYHFEDISNTIYIFTNKTEKGAHVTPWNTILVQDIIFTKYSKNFQDFIFLHEMGHVKTWALFRILHLILAVPSLMLFFASLLCMCLVPLAFLVLYFTDNSYSNLLFLFYGYFLLFLLSSLITLILNWPMEGYATYFAIKKMGERKFQLAMADARMKNKNKKSALPIRYFNRMLYPPDNLVLRIAKWMAK